MWGIGFYSEVARLPFDNIGVAVLTNDNDAGFIFMEEIKYRLIDEALGLEKLDLSSRYETPILHTVLSSDNDVFRLKALTSSSPPPPTQRPVNPLPPQVKFESLAGKYNDAGYGGFELCLVSPKSTTASKACKALAAQASVIFPGAVDPTIPTFLSEWNTTAVSHVMFTHFSGNLFNVSGLNSYVSTMVC